MTCGDVNGDGSYLQFDACGAEETVLSEVECPTDGCDTLTCCVAEVLGCTDTGADNYDDTATQDDGTCTYPVAPACADLSLEGDCSADSDCHWDGNQCEDAVLGCTDADATNYNATATRDDESCTYGDGEHQIDCDGVSDTLPCHVMALIDAVRDATSLHDIDKDIFCPCKLVRDAAMDVNPEVVSSCNGGGP